MLVLPSRPAVAWDAAFVNDDAILSWICRDCSKPGRAPDGAETWVLHATHAWSAARLDADRETIAAAMTTAFAAVVGETVAPIHAAAHRWGYAAADPGELDASLFDPSLGLGAAGETVKIRLSIVGSSGAVQSTTAEGEHRGTALGNCVAAALKKASFPRFRKPAIGLEYTITL